MKLDRWAFIPDLGLGLIYLTAWVLPGLVSAGAAGWLVLGIELEALALFGAYLIAMALIAIFDRTAKILHRVLGVAIILGLVGFAAFQVWRYDFWWPAVGLAVLLGNRLLGFFAGGNKDDARMWMLMDAIFGLGLYMIAVGPTFYFPVPAFGTDLGPLPPEHARWCAVPADFVADFFDKPVTGDWCDEPYRALAGGALYFLASALRDSWRARLRARPRT